MKLFVLFEGIMGAIQLVASKTHALSKNTIHLVGSGNHALPLDLQRCIKVHTIDTDKPIVGHCIEYNDSMMLMRSKNQLHALPLSEIEAIESHSVDRKLLGWIMALFPVLALYSTIIGTIYGKPMMAEYGFIIAIWASPLFVIGIVYACTRQWFSIGEDWSILIPDSAQDSEE